MVQPVVIKHRYVAGHPISTSYMDLWIVDMQVIIVHRTSEVIPWATVTCFLLPSWRLCFRSFAEAASS